VGVRQLQTTQAAANCAVGGYVRCSMKKLHRSMKELHPDIPLFDPEHQKTELIIVLCWVRS
jgi:hypothetical protein